LSAPLAVAAANVPAIAAPADGDPNARLAYLEDLNAIRALNQAFAKHLNALPDSFGEHDVIDIASDRQTATALLHCTVQIETESGPSCPLVEMAKQQGGGVLRRREAGVFEHAYVRRDGIWKMQRSSYRAI
jgi:hypothetical protein